MSTKTTFKRIAIGNRFSFGGSNYRKVAKGGAFRLKENGTGETHAKIPFTRSAACTVAK